MTPEEVKAKAEEIEARVGRKVFVYEACERFFFVTRPSRAVWQRFRDAVSDPDRRSSGTERLVRDCVVDPDPKAFAALLDELPGLPEALAKPISELAGAVAVVEKKV